MRPSITRRDLEDANRSHARRAVRAPGEPRRHERHGRRLTRRPNRSKRAASSCSNADGSACATATCCVLRADHRAPPGDPRPDALMLDSASKAFFHLLARSHGLKKLASRYGMRRPDELRPPVHRRRDDRPKPSTRPAPLEAPRPAASRSIISARASTSLADADAGHARVPRASSTRSSRPASAGTSRSS